MLVVLDVSNRGRGYGYRQLGGYVLASQALEPAEPFEIATDPGRTYRVSVIDGQRIMLTPLTPEDNRKKTIGTGGG